MSWFGRWVIKLRRSCSSLVSQPGEDLSVRKGKNEEFDEECIENQPGAGGENNRE
jgi:hypothetical protein